MCNDDLSKLPRDLLVAVLRRLSASSLLACEATSKTLRQAASDDSLWGAVGAPFWPLGPNLGALAPTCRACYYSANGWAHLRKCTRRVESVEEGSRGARQRGPRRWIAAFDANATMLLIATTHGGAGPETITVRRGDGLPAEAVDQALGGAAVHDVKLPAADSARPLVLAQDADGLARIGVLDTGALHVSWAWQSVSTLPRVSIGRPRFELACPAAAPQRALLRDTTALAVVDLQAGATLSRHPWAGPGGAWEARSACADPQQPEVAVVAWRGPQRSVLTLFDCRLPEGLAAAALETHHANVCRLAAGPHHSCYTSHARCKDIERWDLRRASTSGLASPLSPHGARSAPCERARCSGNAPDFDFQGGVLAAVSGGAAGTQLGAKVHVFSSEPRSLAAECTLPEVVSDETAHRLSCPRGIRVSGRSISLLADAQRVIQCRVE